MFDIIKDLVVNFPQTWSGNLEKAVSSDVACFNSRKALLWVTKCSSSQALELSLSISC